MKCPFLRDTKIKYCAVSAYRKPIADSATDHATERCSSASYVECAAASSRVGDEPQEVQCPFLHESHAEYCGASSVTKYIPANQDLTSRCNSDAHLFCDLYLGVADPDAHGSEQLIRVDPAAENVAIPESLYYAENHMWLHLTESGVCHVGIDAFLASVIGEVEDVSFLTTLPRPAAILTVHGVDLRVEFPHSLDRMTAHLYLRRSPQKLTTDPYGAGWLFEGFAPLGADDPRKGLLPGKSAVSWFGEENDRLAEFVHERLSRQQLEGIPLAADGGHVAPGIAAHLDREDLMNLFNEFFPSDERWRRSW